jgi:hypothetical protein
MKRNGKGGIMNPKIMPCMKCKFFDKGYCTKIQDIVKPDWTGCIIHKTKEAL